MHNIQSLAAAFLSAYHRVAGPDDRGYSDVEKSYKHHSSTATSSKSITESSWLISGSTTLNTLHWVQHAPPTGHRILITFHTTVLQCDDMIQTSFISSPSPLYCLYATDSAED